MEIMEVKYRRNITFSEARKILESYLKVNTYANVAQAIGNNNNQPDKYKALIEKLLQLRPNDWLKIQEQLKSYIQLKSIEQNYKLNKKNIQQRAISLLQK